MDLTGEHRIAAPRDLVWRALNDPEILKRSIPGCEEIDKISDTEFTAKVTAKIGPVAAKFGGKVTLTDLDPPNGYRIVGEGQGGAAGFAKGGATVKLEPDETGQETILRYVVQASVGGKIAQIGSRLIDGSARKIADEFFGRFAEIVAEENAAASAPAATAASAVPPAAPIPPAPFPAASDAAPNARPAPAPASPPARARGLPATLWIGGLIVVVVGLLLIFGR